MIKDEKFLIFSAESTHLVMQVEKMFTENEISCRVIPLPVEISANCGLAVRVEINNLEKAKKIIEEREIKTDISIIEKKGFKKKIEKIYEWSCGQGE